MSAVESPGALDVATPARARRERLRLLFRSPTFLIGLVIVAFWVFCAILGSHLVPLDP